MASAMMTRGKERADSVTAGLLVNAGDEECRGSRVCISVEQPEIARWATLQTFAVSSEAEHEVAVVIGNRLSEKAQHRRPLAESPLLQSHPPDLIDYSGTLLLL